MEILQKPTPSPEMCDEDRPKLRVLTREEQVDPGHHADCAPVPLYFWDDPPHHDAHSDAP